MAVAFVQSANNAASSASSLAKAFNSPNTAANLLVCCVGLYSFSNVFNDPTVTDSQGNVWILLLSTQRQDGLNGQSCSYLFVAYNCKSGANTVTVTVGSSSTDVDFAIHEYSGCASASARDQIAATATNSGTTLNLGSITTQHANEVLLSFVYDEFHSGEIFTPTAGWTAREKTVNPGDHTLGSFDKLVSSTGTYSQSISISSSTLGVHGILVSFADTPTTDTLVQYNSGYNSGASSLAVSYKSANAAGDLLFVVIGIGVSSGSLPTIAGVTDTNGNSWTLFASSPPQDNGAGKLSQLFVYQCLCASGPNIVTVSLSGAARLCFAVLEYNTATLPTASVSNSAHNVPSLASGNLTSSSGRAAYSFFFNAFDEKGDISDFSGTGWRNRLNAKVLSPSSTSNPTLSVYDQAFGGGTIEQTLSFAATAAEVHLILASAPAPAPPPPPPAQPSPCVPVDGSGNLLSGTYVRDLSLFISPATALYANPVLPSSITTSELRNEGRTSIILDFNNGDGLYARDLGCVLEWPTNAGIQVFVWQPSIIPMPEGVFDRASDWDDAGSPGAKFIQGVIVEAFSFGQSKTFFLQDSDTLTLHALNECPIAFARQQEIAFSCAPFVAHSTRVISTDGVEWRIWKSRLVSQPWPETTMNWQTELTSLGMTGWAHAREMNLAYLSTAPVTLTLTFDSIAPVVIALPSTSGVQNKTKIALPPNKWKLIGFQASSTSPFRVFRDDIEVKLREWGAQGPYGVVKPFGGKSSSGALV